MNIGDALSSILSSSTDTEAAEDRKVLLVVRLSRSGRAWFITAAQRTSEGLKAVGFESGCIHSPTRWFNVTSDFFEVAARANAEELLVEVLRHPTPLATIEDLAI